MDPNAETRSITQLIDFQNATLFCTDFDFRVSIFDLSLVFHAHDGDAGLDIGQTIVVSGRACVAVEAMEGTDAVIERAAGLSNGRALVVVKVSKPCQDMRFDVPVVGLKTIQVMRRSNARVLAVDARKTLLFERSALIKEADEAGIAIVGMKD